MNTINKICKDVMVAAGFVFKRGAWYAVSGDFIHVVYFQRSLYSDLYYMELAVDFNPAHWNSFPRDFKFPLYYTLGARSRVKDNEEILTVEELSFEKENQIRSFVHEALCLFTPFTILAEVKQGYLTEKEAGNKYLYNHFRLYDFFLKRLLL